MVIIHSHVMDDNSIIMENAQPSLRRRRSAFDPAGAMV
jgi:hypothetical protein